MKPLVFLHGWAQSKQIWFNQFDAFPDARFLNLPGHGGAEDVSPEHWVEKVAAQLPEEPCLLTGWSLGGMVALEIASRFPERIASLALISTTPCFRQQPDWPAGCDDELFAAFEAAACSDSPRLLNRFFALMLHGDDLPRSDYNRLAKEAVDREHPATALGLKAGLEKLAIADLRAATSGVTVPTLVLHGANDAIITPESGSWLADNMSNARLESFEACGHAPFLTRAERFNTILNNWRQTL